MRYKLTARKSISFITADNNFLIKEDLIKRQVSVSHFIAMNDELFKSYKEYNNLNQDDNKYEIILNNISEAKKNIMDFYQFVNYHNEDLNLEIESIEDIYDDKYIAVKYNDKILAYVNTDNLDISDYDLELHEDIIDFIYDNFKTSNITDAIRIYKEVLLQHQPALYKTLIINNNLED